MGRNSLYYNLPSKKTNKVKKSSKQINKIEPINKKNLLKQINKINLLEQTDKIKQTSKIKLWHQKMGHINPISLQKTLGLQLDIPSNVCEICIEAKLTNQ